MLDIAVSFLADACNADLLRRTGSTALGKVVPGSILDDQGNLAIASGTIALCLVNIEEERLMREQLTTRLMPSGQQVALQPELNVRLTLLFAARMNGYLATLEALSHVLAFFHSHPIFSTADYPALDARVGKLIMELYPSTPEVMNQIWTTIGATYQPSLLYRAQARFIDYLAPR